MDSLFKEIIIIENDCTLSLKYEKYTCRKLTYIKKISSSQVLKL